MAVRVNSVPAQPDDEDARERLEIDLLLEAIQRRHGYDFRGYAPASLRRRLWHRVYGEGLETLSGLQERILHQPGCMERLLRDLSINVTEMFRDPSFYRVLRARVFPLLRTHPFIRVWNAGCSTGEEIYSLAIALREEGLLERTRIYATDINDAALERAGAGSFPLERMQRYTDNYLRAGGTEAFSSYYAADGDSARFDPSLVEGIVLAQHNLVTDGSFNEFHLIVCRNVMIYFGSALQEEVLQLFGDSMTRFGILALGRKESIRRSRHAAEYEALDEAEKIFRRRL
jgi:chemotaxis protein methyltransferase CheR